MIDVIRAFTTTHYAFLSGATEILLSRSVEHAFELKQKFPEYFLMGEVRGLPPEGFDFGNSPAQLSRIDLRGKGLIHRTSNGTKAAMNASHCAHVFVTGFSNAKTTSRFVHGLVNSGHVKSIAILASDHDSQDDLACAEYIRDLLNGDPSSLSEIQNRILTSAAADRVRVSFGENAEDLPLCANERDDGFVMRVGYEADPVVRAVSASATAP